VLLKNIACKEQIVVALSCRYMFVYDLAGIFYDTFKVRPVATLEGSWEFFLSKILSHCEKKRISPRGAHELWPKVMDFVRFKLPDQYQNYEVVGRKRTSRAKPVFETKKNPKSGLRKASVRID
jgi:hypothetical protein